METYFKYQPGRNTANPSTNDNASAEKANTLISEYDRYRQTLVEMDDDKGWAYELRCYRPADVLKETDIAQWWQVCSYPISSIYFM
jgi:hypothetical protein